MLKFKEKIPFITLFIFLFLYQFNVKAQQPDTCYQQGKERVNHSYSCCPGLVEVTEVGTNKQYCERDLSGTTVVLIWGLGLIFPTVLLIFVIFGIRNKLRKKQL